jgi:hypothetical protein
VQAGEAGDGGDGAVAGGEGDLADAVEFLEGRLADRCCSSSSGSRRSVSRSRLPMSSSMTAVSTQMAMSPRTRGSVRWKVGRSPSGDFSTKKRRSTACSAR